MKREICFINISFKVTVTNNQQKLSVLLTYRGILPLKKCGSFCFKFHHFPPTTTLLDEIFTTQKYFSASQITDNLSGISVDKIESISVDIIYNDFNGYLTFSCQNA